MDDEFRFTEETETFNESVNFDYYIAQDEMDTVRETEKGPMVTINKFLIFVNLKKATQ